MCREHRFSEQGQRRPVTEIPRAQRSAGTWVGGKRRRRPRPRRGLRGSGPRPDAAVRGASLVLRLAGREALSSAPGPRPRPTWGQGRPGHRGDVCAGRPGPAKGRQPDSLCRGQQCGCHPCKRQQSETRPREELDPRAVWGEVTGPGGRGAWRREAGAALSLTQTATRTTRRLGASGCQQHNSGSTQLRRPDAGGGSRTAPGSGQPDRRHGPASSRAAGRRYQCFNEAHGQFLLP